MNHLMTILYKIQEQTQDVELNEASKEEKIMDDLTRLKK